MRFATRNSNRDLEVGFGKWLFEVRRRGRSEIKVRRIYPYRYEVQDIDGRGYMVWYSGEGKHYLEGQFSAKKAIALAITRPLPKGHTRKVKHVGSGEVIFEVAP
jgi:hypothetical protein